MNDSPLASAEWLSLVWAMRSAPDDNTPRLIGADWLQETGKPELDAWAQFIRIRCEGPREKRTTHNYSDSCNCTPCKCERKALMVYDVWSLHWSNHTWPGDAGLTPPNPPAEGYARGFVKGVTAQHTGDSMTPVPKLIPPLFERQPITFATVEFYHTHPTHFPDRWMIGVHVKPFTIANGLVVTSRFCRSQRTHVSIDRHRPARTMQSFPKAIGGAIRHALKDRSALNA